MDNSLQRNILNAIKTNVGKYGETSIKSVAESLMLEKVSLAEQKRLAKLSVKENPFITDIKRGEVFVRINKQYDAASDSSAHELLIKCLIATLAGILIYILFHFIAPTLH